MKTVFRTTIFVSFFASGAIGACGSGELTPSPSTSSNSSGPEKFTVTTNNVTHFNASYISKEGASVNAWVEYTPSSTLYEIRTSLGVTLVRAGTAATDKNYNQDWRTEDGVIAIRETDAEYPLVKGLYDNLVALGATPRPSPAEQGTTLYGAAYFAARSLGKVSLVPKSMQKDKVAIKNFKTNADWPYPGFSKKELVPRELQVLSGQQNGNGGVTCCGPYNCVDCDWSRSISCDDWCAAGDNCNDNHLHDCGTASFFPGGNHCNNCPHSNSSDIKSWGNCSNAAAQYCSAWGVGEGGPGPDDHWF